MTKPLGRVRCPLVSGGFGGSRPLVLCVCMALLFCVASRAQGGSRFAGTWEWQIPLQGRFTLSVSGSSISGDWDDPGNYACPVHGQLRAQGVSSGDTAYGTLVYTELRDGSLFQDYQVRLSFDRSTGCLLIRGPKITRGVPDLDISARRVAGPAATPEPSGPIFKTTYTLGYDMPLDSERAVALRIFLSLTPDYAKQYSIASIYTVAKDPDFPSVGRQVITSNESDGFFFWADAQHMTVSPPAGAKEAAYEAAGVHCGNGDGPNLPRTVEVVMHVELKDDQGKIRTEVVNLPIRVERLFTVVSHGCFGRMCPIFKGESIKAGESRKGLPDDKLVLPQDTSAYIKFLNGTLGCFYNKGDQEWSMTMSCGSWGSAQEMGYAENESEIKAVALKLKEFRSDSKLEVLLKRCAGTRGGVISVLQFFGAPSNPARPVAIKLRSKVGVTLYADGRAVVRNFEGAPEIMQKGGSFLPIPVGYQTTRDPGQAFQRPVPISPQDPSVTIWSGLLATPPPSTQSQTGATGSRIIGPDLGRVWSVVEAGEWVGTWTRRPGTNTFDAVWHNTKKPGEWRDEITLESAEGNKVILYRKGNNGRYRGTLAPDRKSVLHGTASWYPPDWVWTAQIR